MQVNREKVRELLKSLGIEDENLNVATDKTYELADILFDLWLESKKQ